MKRLRSILYAPGNNPRLMQKATATAADAVCLVLEDSVPVAERDTARDFVRTAIDDPGSRGKPLYVKVNKPEKSDAAGALSEDLDAVVREGLTGLIVPGVGELDQVTALESLLDEAETRAGLATGSVEVLLVIETPLAVVRAFELAVASPRIVTLICGAAANGDLAGALGLQATPEGTERLFLLSKVLVDARAAGFHTPMDGVWGGIGDIAGLTREAERARQLGYRGKLAIHPEQIEVINRLFTPSTEEIAQQRRILEAFEEALASGRAATVVDGQFIDYAMAATARGILGLAEAVGDD